MSERHPWQDCPDIWKDEKAFLSWLRSQTRRIWSKSPIKIAYKQSRRYKAPIGRNNKEVWVSDCELCGKQSRKCEVDHITPGGSFSDWTSYTKWAKRILWVTFDDIRELCEECHEAVTLSQKLGISFEEAKIEKEVIRICKLPTKEVVAFLKGHGYTGPTNNAKVRRQAVKEVLSAGR